MRFMTLLTIFIDILILAFIIFSFAIGLLMTYFSPAGDRQNGLILVIVGIISGFFFCFFYWYGKDLWRRIPLIETFFADLGALLGLIVVISILAISLILLQENDAEF